MTRLPIAAVVLALFTAACEMTPRFVRQSGDIDAYLARKAYASACVGLAMDDDDSLRAYTARRLAELPHVRVASDCICDELYDAEKHTVDLAVAEGLAGTRRDDLAACLAPAVQDPSIPPKKRPDVVAALARIDAPASYAPLEALAKADPDPAVRAHATRALRPSAAAVGTLIALLSDADAGVRQAAAEALSGHKGREVVSAVSRVAKEDADGAVRAAALQTLVDMKIPETDDLVCKAMLDDPDERVRERAVRAMHGTKRVSALACLQARMDRYEESGAVRKAVLEALGASPSDRAAQMLCDHIGPWLRMYVKDEIADRIEGALIIEAQNNRDWERSYECVAKALQQGGYSCYARNHLGHWMNELGGKASTPWCPGMAKN